MLKKYGVHIQNLKINLLETILNFISLFCCLFVCFRVYDHAQQIMN